MPSIWVDADACPVVVRTMLCKGAERKQIELTFVANQSIPVPPSRVIKTIRVDKGFDVADHYLVANVAQGDLLITADIPLAAEALAKGAHIVTFRGEVLDKQNIGQRLNLRDFYETMRSSGIQSGGPAAFSNQDKHAFAAQLDKWLQRQSTSA